MGEHFLRKQAHGFRHRHDAGFDRLQIPTLISTTKREVMLREIRCEASPLAANTLEAGAEVMLHDNCGQIAVLQANRVVGAVDGAEAASLAEAMRIGCGFLRAQVQRKSRVSSGFVVRLTEEP
ncbi:MAG TPA: hypothetical protein VHC20_03230 [Candidatus Paceibacterota bacterium]|nr:hypothetical protein [Candidatus Paceibacterota bacterium]